MQERFSSGRSRRLMKGASSIDFRKFQTCSCHPSRAGGLPVRAKPVQAQAAIPRHQIADMRQFSF